MTICCLIFKHFIYFRLNSIKNTEVVHNCVWGRRAFSKFKIKNINTVKPNLKKMKLESTQFKDCITEETILAKNLFNSKGFEIRIVGGAVRDLLLGIKPGDLDFATTATPEEMKQMFLENKIRLINTNGEKHGTITARINEQNFEITTLRVDKKTNGRHAEVEFTTDWLLDAGRRDLTINAMYLDFDGNLYDYFNGLEDLKNNRIRFVGDASERIKEDYLRILRYFRFYGKVSPVPDNHEADVIEAIKNNAKGLEIISGERILVELNKILSGRYAGELLLKMINLNIGPYIGLPEKCNEEELKNLTERLKVKDIEVKPMTLIASVFHNEEEAEKFLARVKSSSAERNLLYFIVANRNEISKYDPLRFTKILLVKPDGSTQNRLAFIVELLKYKGYFDVIKKVEEWTIPKFPVNGRMLKSKGLHGKNLGIAINKLIDIWIEHDFNISAEKLLEQIPDDVFNRNVKPVEKKQKLW